MVNVTCRIPNFHSFGLSSGDSDKGFSSFALEQSARAESSVSGQVDRLLPVLQRVPVQRHDALAAVVGAEEDGRVVVQLGNIKDEL